MQTALADIVRQGQENGEITKTKTPDELVDFLFLIARGIVFDWGSSGRAVRSCAKNGGDLYDAGRIASVLNANVQK